MMKFLALRKETIPRLKEQPMLNFFFQRAAGKPGDLTAKALLISSSWKDEFLELHSRERTYSSQINVEGLVIWGARVENTAGEGETLLVFGLDKQKSLTNRVDGRSGHWISLMSRSWVNRWNDSPQCNFSNQWTHYRVSMFVRTGY